MKIVKDHNIKNQNNLNIYKKEPILNVTAVVGSNGSGKSSLLSFIANNICHYKFENGEKYDRFENDSYQKEKSIYVFSLSSKTKNHRNIDKSRKI